MMTNRTYRRAPAPERTGTMTTDPADSTGNSAAPRPPSGQSGTQTLIRGLRVLDAIADQSAPIGVAELSRQLELPKSTVFRLLRTLEQEGWAETSADPVTRWQLSPHMWGIARRHEPLSGIRDIALPHLNALGEKTAETIHFSVPDRNVQLILIERIDSVQAVRTFNPIGASTPFHASASGKAVLAMLPDDEMTAILSRPLDKPTANTSVDPRYLRHQILEVRERGYAVNISENREHVCAIAAAVTDNASRPVAAVAISMPDIRFVPDQVPEWGSWVCETARAISSALTVRPGRVAQ
ncbi:IclR family transcriptional regulator [Rhodococcus koreensis]|uniref:IclR family transcriptional regulator n=1 Tax=Rhodococcus koreensis TaxID=99653 RepID=UPI0036717C62